MSNNWKKHPDRAEYEYCTLHGKRIYYTRGAAERAARELEIKHKGHASVYQCSQCGHYHLTHMDYSESKDSRQSTGGKHLYGNAPPCPRDNWKRLRLLNRMHITQQTVYEWWYELPDLTKVKIYQRLMKPETVNN